jgi:hypothetical protein
MGLTSLQEAPGCGFFQASLAQLHATDMVEAFLNIPKEVDFV